MPGDLATVTAIRGRRGTRRRTIELDGEPWMDLPGAVVTSESIAVGTRIDRDAAQHSLREALVRCARERAYRLLSFKDRSSHELAARLLDDGYPADVIEALLADLVDRGIVDDLRFLEVYATMLARHRGYGRSRVEAELERKGLARDVAAPVLDALLPLDQEAERARHAASRLQTESMSVPRLAARLVRRGFTPNTALHAARDALDPKAEPGMEAFPDPDERDEPSDS